MSLGGEETSNNGFWIPDKFQSEVVKATKGLSVPERQLPIGIDIGKDLMNLGVGMLQRTLQDPKRRERLRIAKVNLAGRLELTDQDLLAKEETPNELIFTWNSNRLESPWGPQYTIREKKAFNVHTHPLEFPPSPTDIASFLRQDVGGEVSLVFGPQLSYLMLKTLETPLLTDVEIDQKDEKWTNMVRERYAKIAKIASNQEHNLALTAKANWAFVRDVSKKYHIPVFTSPTLRSTTFTRAQF
jgi:hypothetical protein